MKIGIKRKYGEMNKEMRDSENISTSTNAFNTAPTALFASLLPPLNKKPKLMQNTNIIPPTWHTNTPQLSPNNPYIKPINHNNIPFQPITTNTNDALSLDSIISTLSGLNSINTTQLDALKNLILITPNTNDRHMHHHTDAKMTTQRTATPTYIPLSSVTLCTKDIKSASCHQCKTKKDVNILFYCTKTRPCSNDSFKRKRCRKKYCDSCMAKYYTYNDVNQLRSIKDTHRWCWECPACIEICTCRACKRKKANNTQNVMDINGTNELQYITPPRYVVNNERISVQRRMTQQSVGNNGNSNNSNGLVQQILSNPQLRILFQ